MSHYLINGQKCSLKDGKLVFPKDEFNAFKGSTNSIATNKERRFSIATQFDENSDIPAGKSVDGLRGYRHAVVSVLVN